MLPGQPARQQVPVSDNQFAQFIQVLVTSQLMQGSVASAGGALAQFVEVAAVSQRASHGSATSSPASASGRMTSMASSVLARSASQVASCILACSSPASARSRSSPAWSYSASW
jgi:hypothetical protein